jgi:hypothetical protein
LLIHAYFERFWLSLHAAKVEGSKGQSRHRPACRNSQLTRSESREETDETKVEPA